MSLIDLSIKEALQRKFELGKASHRNSEEFDGDPLEELFQECLDAMNYCDELMKRGINLSHRRRQFLSTALEVQGISRNGMKRSQS